MSKKIEAKEGEPKETKTYEELLAMGGKFYQMQGESWCDTILYSWRFDPAIGVYRRYDG